MLRLIAISYFFLPLYDREVTKFIRDTIVVIYVDRLSEWVVHLPRLLRFGHSSLILFCTSRNPLLPAVLLSWTKLHVPLVLIIYWLRIIKN